MKPRKQYEKVANFIYRCQTCTSFLALLMSSTSLISYRRAAAYLFNVFTDSVFLENYRMEQTQDYRDGDNFSKTWRNATFEFRDLDSVSRQNECACSL